MDYLKVIEELKLNEVKIVDEVERMWDIVVILKVEKLDFNNMLEF